jgi:hypothetical protein
LSSVARPAPAQDISAIVNQRNRDPSYGGDSEIRKRDLAPGRNANLGTGTLEHFVQEWESAFARARPFIVCPENRHYVLEDRRFLLPMQ